MHNNVSKSKMRNNWVKTFTANCLWFIKKSHISHFLNVICFKHWNFDVISIDSRFGNVFSDNKHTHTNIIIYIIKWVCLKMTKLCLIKNRSSNTTLTRNDRNKNFSKWQKNYFWKCGRDKDLLDNFTVLKFVLRVL